MTRAFLSIGRIERRLSNGNTEAIVFQQGVNLLIGRPNTGKTKWLRMLDYLLGDTDAFETAFEDHIVEKYDSASAELFVAGERIFVERRWKESGAKTKVFVDGEGLAARDFQAFLLKALGIPLLHFPKGNPMSGQTWPELSWRMLLRHVYRQQRFWSGLADQQPDGEQHACLLQFLGLAEHIFTDQFGELIQLKLNVEQLKARREQYSLTLNTLARGVLSDPGLQTAVTFGSVGQAEERIVSEIGKLTRQRQEVISGGRDRAIPEVSRGRIQDLSRRRASFIVDREELSRRAKATAERIDEMLRYQADLSEEFDRLTRAGDAGAVLADLKITHCPACDRPLSSPETDDLHCHLCHRQLPDSSFVSELGATRLKFERDRVQAELKEAEALVDILKRETQRIAADRVTADEHLRMIENELAPAREAVSALVQEEVSAIDMALGEFNERQRQVSRLKGALELGRELTAQIEEIERKISPLQREVDEAVRAADFGRAEEQLSEGINNYLAALNVLRPDIWRHSSVNVNLSRSNFSIKVGSKRWNAALGGTDTLYFLMAYHYALASLSAQSSCHYPGLAIIDLPGDFLGESIEDKENFIVQPFIDLLAQESFSGAQVIIAGASFLGLQGANRVPLQEVFVG